ncbi:hypothetical protein GCM10010284_54800 [Streptomyces rubiginosohelvolus]|uniref:Anti-sigma factor antagonist n=1 Tax=Streptomyces rubiginosohelvolus TaxID=67362 RepID=A0ABQ3CD26_9ACTN|nr:hypothetical protein GCM10010284_54800 [Streptomyces rubiginosohelvolus]GGZ81972.1 hypothetical protein GCM10010328_65680 [Streptomyces pluricolorescens]
MATVTSIVIPISRRDQGRSAAGPSGGTALRSLPIPPEVPSVLSSPNEDRAVRITTRRERGALVLTVSGDLDIDSVSPLGLALTSAAEDGSGPVVVDLSGVGFADSTTVNVLLQGHTALGDRLRLAAPSPFMRRLIGMIGLDSALPVLPSVDDAIDAVLPS